MPASTAPEFSAPGQAGPTDSNELEKQIPVDPERTLFRVGSISKLMVWTAVMQLAEQGKLDLDANGHTYLLSPEPFPLIKTPWYGTLSFQGVLVGLGLLLFVVTLVGWMITALIKRQPSPFLLRLARWAESLFAVVLLAVLVGWVSLLLNTDPAFGAPVVTFSLPPLFYILYGLAYFWSCWRRSCWALPCWAGYAAWGAWLGDCITACWPFPPFRCCGCFDIGIYYKLFL